MTQPPEVMIALDNDYERRWYKTAVSASKLVGWMTPLPTVRYPQPLAPPSVVAVYRLDEDATATATALARQAQIEMHTAPYDTKAAEKKMLTFFRTIRGLK